MIEKRIPPRPAASRLVASFLNRLNAFFDALYQSEYNPFYRSGTLAIGLLLVLLGTGFYLLFFYSVSDPYRSVADLQEQAWLGRWIRALHRYATDAALIAVFFHVIQLLAHGKTWGPRTLAWVSGTLLLIALFISAYTGYVMVWDSHGQLLALSGLQLLKELPIFSPEIGQAFSGEASLPASFFFMNLFLHVAIPLGMVFGMWIHTARLARTVWFPVPAIFCWTLAGLTAAAMLVPATLLPEADLMSIVGRIKSDWWYMFWIPLANVTSPGIALSAWGLFFIIMFSIPWWWRPPRSALPPISKVIEDDCTGCTQCARDCPYEAITMVPHSNGKHLLAKISPIHCVSCGICAASCDVLAVGPPDRASRDQIANIEHFCEEKLTTGSGEIVLIGCTHNDSVPQYLENLAAEQSHTHYIGLNCCGTLHSASLEKILDRAGGVMLCGCAARNCMNRDGLNLLLGRLYGKRVPMLDREIDRERIVTAPHSEHEVEEIKQKLEALRCYLNGEAKNSSVNVPTSRKLSWYFKRTVASTALIALVVVVNQAPLGTNPHHAQLRIMGRLPAQAEQRCRPLTDTEKASLPAHMQQKEICERTSIEYLLSVNLEGQSILEKTLKPSSLRGDLPVRIAEEINIEPGMRTVSIKAQPLNSASPVTEQIEYSETIDFQQGKIGLIEIRSASIKD
ncbi:MAG: cytochrome b N-terminal domain-containing protein [Bdellovibrionales bacterium]|nr:cytochrome b N-terminal domain-containing protein [Bdellovibrionales bacterium]